LQRGKRRERAGERTLDHAPLIAMLSVVTKSEAGAAFEDWLADPGFSSVNAHPFTGGFGRQYYPNVFGSNVSDMSFAIVEDEKPLVMVPCSAGEFRLDYYGMPIRLFAQANLPDERAEEAFESAFAHFDRLVGENRLEEVSIADIASTGLLSIVGKQCLNRRAAAKVRISAVCDLRQSEAEMRRGLRKSYRSLVSWGRRNLKIQCIGRQNQDRTLFRHYQDFHKHVSGRSTRPQQSWDAMFEWIAGGRGELVLGYLEGGDLVAGTMVVDGTEIASYASGVYDRTRFDKPMAHWPLWLAIARSAERGMRLFDLGDLPLAGADQKEIDIGYFKRGFTDVFSTWIAWSWNAPKAAQ
jgi:hypothetical protein